MISYKEYEPINLKTDIDSHLAWTWRNNPEIWRWCRQYTLISPAEQNDWYAKMQKDPAVKMFNVRDVVESVGVCGFTSIDRHNRNAEFSLYISPTYQGKGFGELALRTLVRHGFEDWGFERIWGEVFEDNPAMKMFERVGFVKEGVLRKSYFRKGRFINSTIISMLKDDVL